ncbi:hypothetical protein PVT67_11445 [Gallaecimonas kandeliae]|uniref:hypothetical protein n=1 Tax=Gallaecimonas kandeliae TaxID=3029055 RepID=UPI002648C8A8|nr:hypothetical protein [Gallaecimonas kandeliae]WKE64294.1 hypothetical protein PVT67_11445 [Gallaecimonas kandeliae]
MRVNNVRFFFIASAMAALYIFFLKPYFIRLGIGSDLLIPTTIALSMFASCQLKEAV